MSFLNFINQAASADPTDAGDILLNHIDLLYHPNLMAAAGQSAVAVVEQAYATGDYILAVEGGVPTAFGGRACWAWSYNGQDITFQQAVTDLSRAAQVLGIGTCAFGASRCDPNPTGIKSVKELTGKATINIPGCPPHRTGSLMWWQLLLGNTILLDAVTSGSFSQRHENCPRNADPEIALPPRLPRPSLYQLSHWPVNNKTNWCVNANAPCYACTEPSFPGPTSLYAVMYNHEGTTDMNCSQCHRRS
jgi:hydrogenase small subunit